MRNLIFQILSLPFSSRKQHLSSKKSEILKICDFVEEKVPLYTRSVGLPKESKVLPKRPCYSTRKFVEKNFDFQGEKFFPGGFAPGPPGCATLFVYATMDIARRYTLGRKHVSGYRGRKYYNDNCLNKFMNGKENFISLQTKRRNTTNYYHYELLLLLLLLQ